MALHHGPHRYVERLVDLLDPSLNRLHDIDLAEARRRVLSGDPAAVRAIDGSFAIVAKDGITIRMARSLDRPMRYFLAIDAYLASRALPPAERFPRSLQLWFNGTERYAEQLHEIDRDEYVAMKLREAQRQETVPPPPPPSR